MRLMYLLEEDGVLHRLHQSVHPGLAWTWAILMLADVFALTVISSSSFIRCAAFAILTTIVLAIANFMMDD